MDARKIAGAALAVGLAFGSAACGDDDAGGDDVNTENITPELDEEGGEGGVMEEEGGE